MSKLEQDKISKLEKQFKNKELTQEEYIEKYQNILEMLYVYDRSFYDKRILAKINFKQNQITSSQIDIKINLENHLDKFKSDKIHWIQAEDDLVTPQNILDIFGKYMHHDLIRVSKCEHWIYLEQTELLNNLVEQILN